MKILALNGSPKGPSSNTDVLIQAFLTGARERGAETETTYVADLSITPCRGCFACWTKTPGRCIHDDDMTDLLGRIRACDLLVVGSPLYGNMISGQMKTCLDRTLPLSHPAIEKIGDEYVHPARFDDGVFRFALISNAGFPETHHFDGLKATFRQMERGPRSELCGMICCAAGALLTSPGMEETVRWYLEATIQAGREVVSAGRIAPETQRLLDRSLAENAGAYAGSVNAHWQSLGVEMPSPKASATSAALSQGVPLPTGASMDSVRGLLGRLPSSFSPEEAGGLQATIQFLIPDEEPGAYFLTIEDGVCQAFEGTHPAPSMTIQSSARVWIDVCTGKQDGASAYMSGQYSVSGDPSLLMRFGSLFSGGDRSAEA